MSYINFIQAPTPSVTANVTINVTSPNNTSLLPSKTCSGIITGYSSTQFQQVLTVYAVHCAFSDITNWEIRRAFTHYIVTAKNCNGVGIVLKSSGGHLFCTACIELRKSNRHGKVKQTIQDRAQKILDVEQILARSEVSEKDYKDMQNFLKTPDNTLAIKGHQLKSKVQLYSSYVDQMRSQVKRNSTNISNGLIPSGDTFLKDFIEMYQDKSHRESLLFCLMRAYVAKAQGHNNPEVGPKVSLHCTWFLHIVCICETLISFHNRSSILCLQLQLSVRLHKILCLEILSLLA